MCWHVWKLWATCQPFSRCALSNLCAMKDHAPLAQVSRWQILIKKIWFRPYIPSFPVPDVSSDWIRVVPVSTAQGSISRFNFQIHFPDSIPRFAFTTSLTLSSVQVFSTRNDNWAVYKLLSQTISAWSLPPVQKLWTNVSLVSQCVPTPLPFISQQSAASPQFLTAWGVSPFKFTSLLRMLLAWKVVTGLCSFDWHLSSHETASSVSVSPSCTCSTRRSLDLGQLMPRRYGGWEGGSHGDFNVLPSGKRPRYWRSPTLPRWPSETIMVLVLGCSGRTFRFQILQMLFDWLSVFRSYLPVFAY